MPGKTRKTRKSLIAAAAVMATVTAGASMPASAGMDAYLGEIMWVGYSFCPRGTTEADGKLLDISQNTALFSLYGTMYGGDGRTTFGLPDLQEKMKRGEDGPAIRACVVLQGVYPSRN